jgi:hypothetical protein
MAPAETYECSEQQAFPIDDKDVRRPREEPPLEVNDESGNAPAYLLKLFSEDDEHVDTHAVTASRESTSCNCTAEDLGKTTFSHRPLDQTKQEIRLCQIFPRDCAHANAIIKCRITHHTLDVPPDSAYLGLDLKYTALSYCWGGPGGQSTILLNDHPFQIGGNLHRFMAQTRGRDEDQNIYFWIDQLCIDQSNINERNQQVQRMPSIYSQASAVYSWLGDEDSDTAQAFKVLQELEENEVFHGKHFFHQQQDELINLINAKGPSEVMAFLKLFIRRYWTRVWIVQEVFRSHDFFLLCGSQKRQLRDTGQGWTNVLSEVNISPRIKTVLDVNGLLPHDLVQIDKTFQTTIQLLNYKSQGPGGWLPEDFTILGNTIRQCQDPRDFIFGYQGCSAPYKRLNIDYKMSTEQVFLDFCQAFNGELGAWSDMLRLGRQMGLRGTSREKCHALIYLLHLERKHDSRPFLELVKHEGLSLTLEDAQDKVCARISKEGEEYMRREDEPWYPHWYLKMGENKGLKGRR